MFNRLANAQAKVPKVVLVNDQGETIPSANRVKSQARISKTSHFYDSDGVKMASNNSTTGMTKTEQLKWFVKEDGARAGYDGAYKVLPSLNYPNRKRREQEII